MVKLNKIYTRTGDDGSSGLVDGSRASKAGLRLTAIGEVDEANSFIGVAIAALDEHEIMAERLRLVQNEMFDLGADLATPEGIAGALRITAGQVTRIEGGIDVMNAELTPLTSFILPGGSAAVALAAAERVTPHAIAYLNRLSDHLFVAARSVAAAEGGDVLWQPGATRSS